MKTIGIGVDIVDNNRIKSLIKNKKFVNRIFSKKEITISKKYLNKTNFFLKDLLLKNLLQKR